MAWSDEPSDGQISALHHMVRWYASGDELARRMDYLRKTKTRKEVSDELGRLRDLVIAHKLIKSNCFEAEIWDDFKAV